MKPHPDHYAGTTLAHEAKDARFLLVEDAPAPLSPYGYARRFGVIDTTKQSSERDDGAYAMLPNAVLCFGMTHDDALDALIELRGGRFAEALRE